MLNSFTDVFDKFGGVSKFANAVGMKRNTAKIAKARKSLAPRWFGPVARAAEELGIEGIDEKALVELAEKRWSE